MFYLLNGNTCEYKEYAFTSVGVVNPQFQFYIFQCYLVAVAINYLRVSSISWFSKENQLTRLFLFYFPLNQINETMSALSRQFCMLTFVHVCVLVYVSETQKTRAAFYIFANTLLINFHKQQPSLHFLSIANWKSCSCYRNIIYCVTKKKWKWHEPQPLLNSYLKTNGTPIMFSNLLHSQSGRYPKTHNRHSPEKFALLDQSQTQYERCTLD